MKNIDPPLGFGKKCPDKMAYKRLIRMNMPIDKEGRVAFTTTLFALIRDNLKINVREASATEAVCSWMNVMVRGSRLAEAEEASRRRQTEFLDQTFKKANILTQFQ